MAARRGLRDTASGRAAGVKPFTLSLSKGRGFDKLSPNG
jgi:hypothetical protein